MRVRKPSLCGGANLKTPQQLNKTLNITVSGRLSASQWRTSASAAYGVHRPTITRRSDLAGRNDNFRSEFRPGGKEDIERALHQNELDRLLFSLRHVDVQPLHRVLFD